MRAVSTFSRDVHVYETDMMGIVHHSNYLRFCEEARVDWCRRNGLIGGKIEDVFGLTVLETAVRHIKPIRFGSRVTIQTQVKLEKVRLIFQYRLLVNEDLMCAAQTTHCCLDLNFKVKKPSPELVKQVEKEKWTETWL